MPIAKTPRPKLDRLKMAELLERAANDERVSKQTQEDATRAARLLRKIEERRAAKAEQMPRARDLTPHADEMADPEACYRRGFQHGAVALLRLVTAKLDPADARELAGWAGVELRDWRVVGHELADSPEPPAPPKFSN